MKLSDVKVFWENDKFNNIIPRGYGDFPEGFDPRDELKKIVDKLDYSSIVELGCGYGRLCKAFDTDKYIGVDISDYAIDEARLRNPDYKFRRYSHPKAMIYLAYTVFLHLTDEQVLNELSLINCDYLLLCEILGSEWANLGKGVVPTYNRDLKHYNEMMLKENFKLLEKIDRPYHRYIKKFPNRNTDISFLLYKNIN